jgi:hypothetical protein
MVSNRSSSAFGGSPHGTFGQRWSKKQDVDIESIHEPSKENGLLTVSQHRARQEKDIL